MGAITNELVEKAYVVAKEFYENRNSLKESVEKLASIGWNENSAVDYIYNYSNLVQGKLFTRTTNSYATEYYLHKIYEENGKNGLQNALLSLSQHIDYYEEKTGSAVKARKDIYHKYLKFIDDSEDKPVYPDEVDPDIKYPEGKTKKVLINSFERNTIARKKCIEHFGSTCQVCSLNFKDKYGELGAGFIHVHHKIDISLVGDDYSVNPIADLIPVCPNCHAMLHKRKPAYTVEELRYMLSKIDFIT